jgi:hypothetical protein
MRVVSCVLAAILLGAALTATPRAARADPNPNEISVGGVWVSNITHDGAGYTADQRAVEVRKRITDILSNPKYRQAGAVVSVRPLGAAATIYVGDQLAMTVMPEDAAGTGVTTVELAKQWAQRLAQGLSKALPDANFHTF